MKKTTASNLVTQDAEKTAAAYKEKQFILQKKEKSKPEIADEVNEELGTLKPPAFSTVENFDDFQEKMDSSRYYPLHEKKKVSLHWSGELMTTTDSANTVYFELLPPRYGKSNSLNKGEDMTLTRDDILEQDEQLQRAQSQSIIASRNSPTSKTSLKINFPKTSNSLQQSDKVTADKIMMPTTGKGQDITTQLRSEKSNSSGFVDIAPQRLPETGKISPNTKTTFSYTVFLDPLTINDGLMNVEKGASHDKTKFVNAQTNLPNSEIKTTYAYVESTTPATLQWYSTVSTNITGSRRGKSKSSNKISPDESNENELMETMQKKANQMFGDLNESEADHLMNVMKTADKNKSVRRLILLLIQTCDDDYNKTAEDSRKALLSALISMDHQEIDSSEIQVVKSRYIKREKALNKSSTTVATPITSYRNIQFERLTDTTPNFDQQFSAESSETTTTNYNEIKSTNLDSFETSTTIFTDGHLDDNTEATTMSINFFADHYTSTYTPTTTIDYDTATNAFTTTELPTTAFFPTTFNTSWSSYNPTMNNQQVSLKLINNINTREKNILTSEDDLANSVRSNSNQHSDARALELLRSLYSLASRWG